MAEPILGQALALQSEFRPDTSQVLTRAVDKIGNVTLKKQLAEQKAAEAKAKREQEILSAVKLDGAKVNKHFLPEAQKRYAQGIAQMQEYAMKGDILGVNNLKGQLEMEFNNLSEQSKALDNFLSLKKQGFYIAPEIEMAFSMPKEQGQAYLQEVYKQKPELKGIVDVNEYGDYVFNPIKDLDLQEDFRSVVTKNELLFKPTGQKVIDQTTKDQLEVYKIPKANIQEFALLKSQDPEIKANIILKDKAGLATYVDKAKAANPSATPEQIENTALVSYIGDKLEKINAKTVKSNIPQKRGDFTPFGINPLTFDPDDTPRGGSIPIDVTGTTNGKQITFKGQVATGNPYGFNLATIGGTNSDGVIDVANNQQLQGKTFQKVEAFETVAVPVATRDFTTSRGIKYNKGQMLDKGSVNVAVRDGFAQYQPMIKGIATYKEKDNYSKKEQVVTTDVLIPASRISTAVVSAQSEPDAKTTYNYIQAAKKEADELNARYRKSKSNTVSSQPKKQEVVPQGGKLEKALAAFEKQMGRKPTPTELDRIKQKYK